MKAVCTHNCIRLSGGIAKVALIIVTVGVNEELSETVVSVRPVRPPNIYLSRHKETFVF